MYRLPKYNKRVSFRVKDNISAIEGVIFLGFKLYTKIGSSKGKIWQQKKKRMDFLKQQN